MERAGENEGTDSQERAERMKLKRIEALWDEAARQDAQGNIFVGVASPEEFWASGEREIRDLMTRRHDLHPPGSAPSPRLGRALDFGCGVGRLSQPLARRFARVDAVDVSWEMVNLARDANAAGPGRANLHFHHNPRGDLRLFEDDSFDLIYSMIVLQHMPPTLAGRYVREFVRVARPGSLIAFQLPEPYNAKPGGDRSWLHMYGARPALVESWLDGAELVRTESDEHDGVPNHLYVVRA